MDTNDLYRIKHTILLHTIRDLLIEKGVISKEEFKELYYEKVDKANLSDEVKEQLKETI